MLVADANTRKVSGLLALARIFEPRYPYFHSATTLLPFEITRRHA